MSYWQRFVLRRLAVLAVALLAATGWARATDSGGAGPAVAGHRCATQAQCLHYQPWGS